MVGRSECGNGCFVSDEGHVGVCNLEVGDLRLLPEVGKVSVLVARSLFHVLELSERDSWAARPGY